MSEVAMINTNSKAASRHAVCCPAYPRGCVHAAVRTIFSSTFPFALCACSFIKPFTTHFRTCAQPTAPAHIQRRPWLTIMCHYLAISTRLCHHETAAILDAQLNSTKVIMKRSMLSNRHTPSALRSVSSHPCEPVYRSHGCHAHIPNNSSPDTYTSVSTRMHLIKRCCSQPHALPPSHPAPCACA